MSTPRYAIYFTPPPDSPLAIFGAGVIGYDCFQRAEVPRWLIQGIDPRILALLTVNPRRYGFHATLVPPFHLALDVAHFELAAAFSTFAENNSPVGVGQLRVGTMDKFIVLRPVKACPSIDDLATSCVATFDQYRAPANANDRARRDATGLTPRQVQLLERWGYPYVLDEFCFHMTLAGPLPEGERHNFKKPLSKAFNGLASDHLEVGEISLMRQDDPASYFYVLARHRLTG